MEGYKNKFDIAEGLLNTPKQTLQSMRNDEALRKNRRLMELIKLMFAGFRKFLNLAVISGLKGLNPFTSNKNAVENGYYDYTKTEEFKTIRNMIAQELGISKAYFRDEIRGKASIIHNFLLESGSPELWEKMELTEEGFFLNTETGKSYDVLTKEQMDGLKQYAVDHPKFEVDVPSIIAYTNVSGIAIVEADNALVRAFLEKDFLNRDKGNREPVEIEPEKEVKQELNGKEETKSPEPVPSEEPINEEASDVEPIEEKKSGKSMVYDHVASGGKLVHHYIMPDKANEFIQKLTERNIPYLKVNESEGKLTYAIRDVDEEQIKELQGDSADLPINEEEPEVEIIGQKQASTRVESKDISLNFLCRVEPFVNTVVLEKYIGKEPYVTLPKEYSGYPVSSVEPNVFVDTKAEVVEIDCNYWTPEKLNPVIFINGNKTLDVAWVNLSEEQEKTLEDNKAWAEEVMNEEKISVYIPQSIPQALYVAYGHDTPEQIAVKASGKYISVQQTEEGYDYSIYDRNYKLIDGGLYEDPDVDIVVAVTDIANDAFITAKPQVLSFDELQEKVVEVERKEIEQIKETVDESKSQKLPKKDKRKNVGMDI